MSRHNMLAIKTIMNLIDSWQYVVFHCCKYKIGFVWVVQLLSNKCDVTISNKHVYSSTIN